MKTNKMSINIFASLLSFIIQFAISFVLSPYIISKLGEEAYGFVNLSNNFVSYASLLAIAINSMATRFISIEYNRKNHELARKYFSTVFWTNVILSATVFIFSLFFIYNLESIITITESLIIQVKITFLLSFLNLCISFLGTVYTAATFTTNNMHYSSIIQIIGNCLKSILLFLLFVAFPAKIYFLSVATLIYGCSIFYGNYKISKKLIPEFTLSIKFVSFPLIIQLIKSGVWMLISNISNLLLNGFDLILANQLLSGVMMGRLSIAKQIPTAISNVLGYFSSIFNASITKTFAVSGQNEIVGETKTLLRTLTLLFTVPYAGLIVYGKDFLTLWLSSSEYTINEIEQIYFIMIVVLIDIIISTYMYSIHSVFIALNKIRVYSIVLFLSSLISITLTYFLLATTNLGVYAISGTSTAVLGIAHGIIVPIYAALLLREKKTIFLHSEFKSWSFLVILSSIYLVIKIIYGDIDSWLSFFVLIILNSLIGYFISYLLIFTKQEKQTIKMKVKNYLKAVKIK